MKKQRSASIEQTERTEGEVLLLCPVKKCKTEVERTAQRPELTTNGMQPPTDGRLGKCHMPDGDWMNQVMVRLGGSEPEELAVSDWLLKPEGSLVPGRHSRFALTWKKHFFIALAEPEDHDDNDNEDLP